MKRYVIWAFTFFLYLHIYSLNAQENNAQFENFCTADDDTVECTDQTNHESTYYQGFNLKQLDGVKVGHVQDIKLEDGRIVQLRTLSLKPVLFEIPDFLSSSECTHLMSLASRQGLEESITVRTDGMTSSNVKLLDVNSDERLSLNEMILTIENSFDLYLNEDDVIEMYKALGIDNNDDKFITPEELQQINVKDLVSYLSAFAKMYPIKQSRYSKQSWLYPDSSTDDVFKQIQDRVVKVTGLPPVMIKKSDFQVVVYDEGGHYNAHQDSDVSSSIPCCTKKHNVQCRICRFMTVLFYLNDVPEGGGTAFPVAGNDTYDEQELRLKHLINLQQSCDEANIVVQPKQGKAVIWYNHHVDESTGWIGEMDVMSWHGGCPVIRGQKWIANFWIRYSDDKKAFLTDN